MGMKGSWISALKKAFTPKSKKKVHTGQDNNVKEKRLGIARKRHGEVNSFIPLYRETSSIEKILGDVEREEQYTANTPKNAVPDKVKTASSDRKTTVISYKEKSIISSKQAITRSTESITSNHVHISATKIQAVYRGYMGRKRYRTLKGLLRLKNMMKGQSVKRQTMNTMRSMQLLVRIQIQIHSRRLQMMESQNIHQDQISWRSSKEPLSGLSKWNATNQLEGESNDEWDDSMLTKEERAASIKRKVEAVMKRDRALAYAYSHQLLTITPKNAHAELTDSRSGGFPLWWNWLERQIPSNSHHTKTLAPPPTPRPLSIATTSRTSLHRPSSRSKPSKTPFDASTPRFPKTLNTHISSNRWQATHARPALRDDDSLTSCPAFTVPNYMSPTVSAKAKVRSTSIEGGGGAKKGSRRFSFALSQSIGSLRLFSAMKDAAAVIPPAKSAGGRHRSTLSVGELSVDSTVSVPAGLGRRALK